jgi:multisubunit Na+/H+ antiporter MnhB subunit
MEKLFLYILLLLLALFWAWLYAAAPALQGIVIIATILGLAASGCGYRSAREGR